MLARSARHLVSLRGCSRWANGVGHVRHQISDARVINLNAQDHRAVAALQIRRRKVHAVVETVQNAEASGEGSLEISRTGTEDDWGRCNQALKRRFSLCLNQLEEKHN